MKKNTIKVGKNVLINKYYIEIKLDNGERVTYYIFKYLGISFEEFKEIMHKGFGGYPEDNIKARKLMDETFGIKKEYTPADEPIYFWEKENAIKAMKWIQENANIPLEIVEEKREQKKERVSMLDLIRKIANILEQMKGFTTGYSTGIEDKMLIDYNGKRYILTLKEIEEPKESMNDDLNMLRVRR